MPKKPRSRDSVLRLVLAAMLLALAFVLPFLTGQIPQIGSALCPMHMPVLLCGFFCGPWYAAVVGMISPLLRFALLGLPPILPSGVAMSFELMAYGLLAGVVDAALRRRMNKDHRIYAIYLALFTAMLGGRAVWGITRLLLAGLDTSVFGWQMFLAGAFVNAMPAVIIQVAVIPPLVLTVETAFPQMAKTDVKQNK